MMSKKRFFQYFQTLLFAALVLTGCIFAVDCYLHRDGGFSPSRVAALPAKECSVEAPALSCINKDKLKDILSQTFHYNSKGSQCYTFLSDDEQYVLKIFKTYHLRLYHFHDKVPVPGFLQDWRKSRQEKKSVKRDLALKSYRIALSELKGATGLLAGQWGDTRVVHQPLDLSFPSGRRLLLDTDSVDFLVQRRAVMAEEVIEKALAESDEEKVREVIASYFQLTENLLERGIADFDARFDGCFGFVDGQTIYTDVGEFRRIDPQEKDAMRQELRRRMLDWLERRFPDCPVKKVM